MEKRIQIVYAGMYGSTAGVAEAIGQEFSRLGAVVETQLCKLAIVRPGWHGKASRQSQCAW